MSVGKVCKTPLRLGESRQLRMRGDERGMAENSVDESASPQASIGPYRRQRLWKFSLVQC